VYFKAGAGHAGNISIPHNQLAANTWQYPALLAATSSGRRKVTFFSSHFKVKGSLAKPEGTSAILPKVLCLAR